MDTCPKHDLPKTVVVGRKRFDCEKCVAETQRHLAKLHGDKR